MSFPPNFNIPAIQFIVNSHCVYQRGCWKCCIARILFTSQPAIVVHCCWSLGHCPYSSTWCEFKSSLVQKWLILVRFNQHYKATQITTCKIICNYQKWTFHTVFMSFFIKPHPLIIYAYLIQSYVLTIYQFTLAGVQPVYQPPVGAEGFIEILSNSLYGKAQHPTARAAIHF